MILRDGGLIAKRGITLPITVRESIEVAARESGGKTPSLQQRCRQEW